MTLANRKLDFVVIGAPKSGTTPLYEWMKGHPDIYLPPGKEIPFFTEAIFEKGLDSYLDQHFRPAKTKQIIGTVTPQYMDGVKDISQEKIASRMYETIPEAKLIVILRHPIERAYSHYKMSVRRGHEKRTFEEAVVDLLKPSNLERSRKYNDDTNSYVSTSEYGRVLNLFFELYGSQNIAVYMSSDLRTRPVSVLKSIFQYLGVDDSYVPENINVEYHKGGSEPKMKLLTPATLNRLPLISQFWYGVVPDSVRRRINFRINRWNVKPDDNKVAQNGKAYSLLVEHFKSDIVKLEKLIERDITWNEWRH